MKLYIRKEAISDRLNQETSIQTNISRHTDIIAIIAQVHSADQHSKLMPRQANKQARLMKRPAQKRTPDALDLLDWPAGPELPDWPEHAVTTLIEFLSSLKTQVGDVLTVCLWSDCGGMSLEAISLKKLAATLLKHTGSNSPQI